MKHLLADFKWALRTLVRRPIYAICIIATLTIAIGANTAVFGLFESVIIRGLPFPSPNELVMIFQRTPSGGRNLTSTGTLLDWREMSKSFQHLGALTEVQMNLSEISEPEQVTAGQVSANFFRLMGETMQMGRDFHESEELEGAGQVAVLSDHLWRRRYRADPQIVGKSIRLNGNPYVVVGVLNRNSSFERFIHQLWVPLKLDRAHSNRKYNFLRVLGRIKPGISVEQAQLEANGVAKTIGEMHPETNKDWGILLVPLREVLVGDNFRRTIVLFSAVVLCILLIACANIANLVLAQTVSRCRDMAIRVSLGGSRKALVQQVLVENLMLGLLGGLCGIVAGMGLLKALRILTPPDILPWTAELTVRWPALLVTLGLAIVAGVSFGLLPAILSTKPNIVQYLKSARGSIGSQVGRRFRQGLCTFQIALALVLLFGMALFARSIKKMQGLELGFNPKGVVTFQVTVGKQKDSSAERLIFFYDESLRRLEALPGVQGVALAGRPPTMGNQFIMPFSLPGEKRSELAQQPEAPFHIVSPSYFRTMALEVKKGRVLTPQDTMSHPRVLVINEEMAAKHFPNQDPIGKYIEMNSLSPWERSLGDVLPWQVVGVVANVKEQALVRRETPQMYASYLQNPSEQAYILIKTTGEPMMLANTAKKVIYELNRDQPINSVRSLEEIVKTAQLPTRFRSMIVGIFAVIALVLAGIGVYGIASHSATQRAREIGIRLVLGATPRQIGTLLLRECLLCLGGGILAGLIAAYLLRRVMIAVMFEAQFSDLITLAPVMCGLAFVVFLSSANPLRRAMRSDPAELMRQSADA